MYSSSRPCCRPGAKSATVDVGLRREVCKEGPFTLTAVGVHDQFIGKSSTANAQTASLACPLDDRDRGRRGRVPVEPAAGPLRGLGSNPPEASESCERARGHSRPDGGRCRSRPRRRDADPDCDVACSRRPGGSNGRHPRHRRKLLPRPCECDPGPGLRHPEFPGHISRSRARCSTRNDPRRSVRRPSADLDTAALVAARNELHARIEELQAGDSRARSGCRPSGGTGAPDDGGPANLERLALAGRSRSSRCSRSWFATLSSVSFSASCWASGSFLLLEALDARIRSSSGIADRLELPLLARLAAPPRKNRRRNRLVILTDQMGRAPRRPGCSLFQSGLSRTSIAAHARS